MAGTSAAIRAGRAFVEFFIEDGRLERGLKTIERKLQVFGRRVSNIGKRATAAALAATITLAFPVKGYAEFDDKIKELESLATRGATSLRELREQAKQLGRDTSFTAIQVAGGQTEMARAGFNTDEIKEGIDDVMNLARATQTELPRATEIGAGTLRAFQLPITDMTRVVNVAVATVNKSAIGMEDYAESMKYVGPVANMMGQSLEETSKQIGILGNLQIKGSLAGTAMRNAFMRIADPEVRGELEKFTPIVDRTTGRIKDLSQIMTELGTATAGEDPETRMQRLALFTQLFGIRSTAAAMVLSENVAAGFDEAFADQDFAKNVAKHMDSGIGGAFRILQSAWEGVTISFGEAVDGMLQRGASGLTKVLGVVRGFIDKNPKVAQGLLMVVAAVAAVGVAGIVAGYALQGFALWFRMLAGVLSIVRIGLTLTAGAFKAFGAAVLLSNPYILVMGGLLAGLVAWFVYCSGAIQTTSAFLRENFGTAWATIVALIQSGDLAAAFALAMALVRASWVIAISALKAEWAEWTGSLGGVLLEGTAIAELAWFSFTSYLTDIFDTTVGKITQKWRELQDWLAEKILIHMELFNPKNKELVWVDDGTGANRTQRYQRYSGLRESLQTLREDQARRPNAAKEAEQRSNQRKADVDAKAAEVAARLEAQKTENNQMTADNVARAQADAEAARKAFADAQAAADKKVAENNAPNPEDQKKKQQDQAEELRNMFGQGPKAAAGKAATNEAVLLRSKEGAEAIARALGFAGQQDKVVGAIQNLQDAAVNAIEHQEEVLKDMGLEGW